MAQDVKVAVFGARGGWAPKCAGRWKRPRPAVGGRADLGDDRSGGGRERGHRFHPSRCGDGELAWCIDHGIHAVVGTTGSQTRSTTSYVVNWTSALT